MKINKKITRTWQTKWHQKGIYFGSPKVMVPLSKNPVFYSYSNFTFFNFFVQDPFIFITDFNPLNIECTNFLEIYERMLFHSSNIKSLSCKFCSIVFSTITSFSTPADAMQSHTYFRIRLAFGMQIYENLPFSGS